MNFEKFKHSPINEKEQKQDASLKYEAGVGIRFTELLKDRNKETQDHNEEDPVENREKKVLSAERTTQTFIEQGEQRIAKVDKEIDLPTEDIASVRSEMGLAERFKKIRTDATVLLKKFKDKVSELLVEQDVAPTNKIGEPQIEDLRNNTLQGREYVKREQREISSPVIEEARRKRDQLLEARGLLEMPKADFDAYFASKDFEIRTDLKQQNVGDCYAVAAIHAMSRSPHFEMICRSGMKRNPDGSWQVRIPLLSENGQLVTITPDELSPQKNKKFLRWHEEGKILPDLRYRLKPVKGKEGLQVLEAAFMKAKFGSVDRLAAEGGWGDEVLLTLGGDNFKQFNLNSSEWDDKKGRWKYPGLDSLPQESVLQLDEYLENFDPEIHIATASTKHLDLRTINGIVADQLGLPFYKGKGTFNFFVAGHAYSVSEVDPKARMVHLANPWDTAKPIKLTFDQFKGTFCGFEAIRIDSSKLLSNMKRVEQQAA